jgi:hypothetical protein
MKDLRPVLSHVLAAILLEPRFQRSADRRQAAPGGARRATLRLILVVVILFANKCSVMQSIHYSRCCRTQVRYER